MLAHLKKLWPSYSTVAAAVVIFLAPSIQHWIGAHPAYSIPATAVWGVFLHWAQSPRSS